LLDSLLQEGDYKIISCVLCIALSCDTKVVVIVSMAVWPELESAIKFALEKEFQRMKDIIDQSLKAKNLEIKTLQERIMKLESENTNVNKKTQELEKFVLDQDSILLKRNKQIEESKSKFEGEEIRLKEHIFRRKLKIKELRAENDELTENNKKLETLVKKQEATIQSLQSETDVNIGGTLNLKLNMRESEQKDVKKGHKRNTRQPAITNAPPTSSTSTNLLNKMSDESFLERIRSKTIDTKKGGRDSAQVNSNGEDSISKRKRSQDLVLMRRTVRKRSI